jgi:hypothetical protein
MPKVSILLWKGNKWFRSSSNIITVCLLSDSDRESIGMIKQSDIHTVSLNEKKKDFFSHRGSWLERASSSLYLIKY